MSSLNDSRPHCSILSIIGVVETPRQRPGLDAEAVHTLSNHLAVILGFVELILADLPADDPRHGDLVEIREAAHECARIVNRTHDSGSALIKDK